MRRACLGLFVLALTHAAPPALADAGLVIGNSRYASLPQLPACNASAQVVAAALRRAGFAVTQLADLSNGEMGAAISGFAAALARAPSRAAVIYVCGYAIGYDSRPFLLPTTADIQRETDPLTQGLVAKSLLAALVRSGVAGGLVLLDAVAAPIGTSPLGLDKLAGTPAEGGVGLAAAALVGPLPQGATRLAAAFAQELTKPDVELGALLQALAAVGPLAVHAPAVPAWLTGGPAETPAPPPVAAEVPTKPAPASVAALPDEAHMTEPDRRRIQAALARLGYYDGAVDGVFGQDTRAAIRRFQHELGTAMDGRIKPDQAGRLLATAH